MNLAILVIAICPSPDAPPGDCKAERRYAEQSQYRCEWQAVSEQNRLSRQGKYYLPAQCQPANDERVAKK